MDVNVGQHCLKVLVLILQAFNRSCGKLKKDAFVKCLKIGDDEFIKELISFKEDSDQGGPEENIKTRDILVFILESIYNLDPKEFTIIASRLGYANKSESKSFFKAMQIEKTIKNTSEGGDIGEYKQLLWGPKSKSLIGNFTSHQQIKDLELIVVGYIDGKNKNNH